MKRTLSLVLTFLILCSLTIPAFAAEITDGSDVVAKYNITYEGEYRADVTGGAATAGGVSVTDAPENAVTLVVVPMEGDALAWADSCVSGDAVAAYDIHFLDADGNRINASGAKVSITVSGSELQVSSVTTSGADNKLTSEASGSQISFTTDGGHYYVICGASEPVPPHEHDYTKVITEPTCTEKGYTTYTCECGDSYVADYTDPTGHSFTKYESNNDATCKKDGTETAKCDHGCGKTDTRTDKGSKLGHKYENGKCVRCGLSWWNPETGDNSNIFLWAGILVLSLITLFFLVFWKRRKKDEA